MKSAPLSTAAGRRLAGRLFHPPRRKHQSSPLDAIICDSADEVVQPEQVLMLASRYPSSTFVELPAGHLQGIKTASREYVGAVTSFLDSLTLADTA